MDMDSGETPLGRRARNRAYCRAPEFLRLSDLRTLRKCEKVAAVCFRIRGGILEFLLVQTRGGRWTFPKGNTEPGLTTAQAAALEAFEEAGVHGRMEEISFATYVRPRRRIAGRPGAELMVTAHLCEVLWLDSPQESGRNPTWFSPERAKRRLREDRSESYAMELARVVDRAASRIKQLRTLPILQTAAVIDIHDIRSRSPIKALSPGRSERRNKPPSEK
jgi:8-oxo-dGTP pyrophosphatase MutT (NUDIX family)